MKASCWENWMIRWTNFQERYVPCREEQFRIMLDYVSLRWGRVPLRMLDLCSGPGSISGQILARFPHADVVAVDLDPWLVEMGRQTVGRRHPGRMTWVEADLRSDGWVDCLGGMRFQAVLSATALHWFTGKQLERLYHNLTSVLVEGGLFSNADLLPIHAAGVAGLARELSIRWQEAQVAEAGGEDWRAFWEKARTEPAFRDFFVRRDSRFGPRTNRPALPAELHRRMLLDAGFRGASEVWRRHEHAILLAIR
jgi:SAM-dependent methyltransferase